MGTNIIEKRKPLLVLTKGQKGWGSFTCQFCGKRIKPYNRDRHIRSVSHKRNVLAYENENKVTVFENILTLV